MLWSLAGEGAPRLGVVSGICGVGASGHRTSSGLALGHDHASSGGSLGPPNS